MKTKLMLVCLISSLFFLSDCDFGVGNDLEIDLGNLWSYFDYGYYDWISTYPTNYSRDDPAINSMYIEAESIELNENSSATLYFFAVADTTVVLDRIDGRLGTLVFINGKYTSSNIDYTIVHISNDNCLQDSSILPDPVSFEMLKDDTSLRDTLEENTNYFKKGLKKAGFDVIDGDSAIVPLMLYAAKLAHTIPKMLLKERIYVIGFFFPVVPKGKARIRVQLSAAHTKSHLDKAILAFKTVGKTLKII